MALQTSGQISLNDVNVELGFTGTAQLSMGSADVRGLFGVSSGQITMANGYGASDLPAYPSSMTLRNIGYIKPDANHSNNGEPVIHQGGDNYITYIYDNSTGGDWYNTTNRGLSWSLSPAARNWRFQSSFKDQCYDSGWMVGLLTYRSGRTNKSNGYFVSDTSDTSIWAGGFDNNNWPDVRAMSETSPTNFMAYGTNGQMVVLNTGNSTTPTTQLGNFGPFKRYSFDIYDGNMVRITPTMVLEHATNNDPTTFTAKAQLAATNSYSVTVILKRDGSGDGWALTSTHCQAFYNYGSTVGANVAYTANNTFYMESTAVADSWGGIYWCDFTSAGQSYPNYTWGLYYSREAYPYAPDTVLVGTFSGNESWLSPKITRPKNNTQIYPMVVFAASRTSGERQMYSVS